MKPEASWLQRYPRLLYTLGAVGVYMMCLIVSAPASLMEWALPRLTHDRIFLEQSEGGLWHGQARSLVVRKVNGDLMSMGGVHWDVFFLPLLKLELAVKVDVSGGQNNSSGIISAGIGKLHLRQINATLPASLLPEFYPAWQTWRPDGFFKFSADNFTISRHGINGAAELEWHNAAVGLSKVRPLGNYQITIQGGQKVARFVVSTVSGVLNLAGKGEWSADDGLDFQGTARGDPSKTAELKDFLALLGSEQSNDIYHINISNVKLRK